MATQQFTPEVQQVQVDPSQIKQQYAQMNQAAQQQVGQPPISEEQIKAHIAKEMDRLDLMLPYYRKQKEALELEIAITTMEVQMGKVAAANIPGSVGRQLESDEMDIKLRWAHLKMQTQQTLDGLQKQKEELKKEVEAKEATQNTPDQVTTIDTNTASI